jgi:hypothetical protein
MLPAETCWRWRFVQPSLQYLSKHRGGGEGEGEGEGEENENENERYMNE